MGNWIRVAAGLVIVLGAGLVHGEWTNRWRLSDELVEMARRLDLLPMTIGDWTARSLQLPEDERRVAGAAGAVLRRYRNLKTGVEASVLLLCGPPGNIVNHTPDVCYPAQGYSLGEPELFRTSARTAVDEAEFLTAIAERSGITPSRLRIFWSWNGAEGEGWRTPNAPFLSFAAAPALCKLYIVRNLGSEEIAPEDDPARELMAELIPAIDRSVFAADGAAAR